MVVSVDKLLMFVLLWCSATHSLQNVRRSISSSSTTDSPNFSLLWIDDSIRECPDDCRQTQLLLRELVLSAEFEWDLDDVIYTIGRIKNTKKILLVVVSGRKASLLFQYLNYYDLNEDIGALFIFCNNPEDYQHLQHTKLSGIFTDPKVLAESIRANKYILLAKNDKISLNPFDQEQTWSRMKPSDTLTRIWHQLFLEVILELPRDEQAKQEMIKKSKEYYVGQSKELQQIEQFASAYTPDMAIEWYTADSFVHKLVNKALRSENIDLLYAFRFFISDLKAEIKQEHIAQQNKPGTVASRTRSSSGSLIKLFSGQQLLRSDINRLGQSVGTIISINSFLSTSLRLSEAKDFATRGVIPVNMQPVLIEISLDTSLENMTIFAEVEHRTRFRGEREVLFDCNALFNVTYVQYDWFSEIWEVRMKAVPKTSLDEHPYLKVLRDTVIQNHSPIVTFDIILAQGFERKEQALRYFDQLLLTWPSDHVDFPDVLQQRAIFYEENGEHALALRDYERAIEIRQQRVRENLLSIVEIKNNVGILQTAKSDFQASLDSHQEALNIYEKVFGMNEDHVTKAKIIENIGVTYYRNGNASKALEHLKSAKTMYSRILPREHFFMIELLGHLGTVHEAAENSTLAVKFFRRQLDWSEKILPSDHPLLIKHLDSVLRVHTKFNQTSNISALFSEYLQKLNKTLGEHHPIVPRLLLMVASLLEPAQPFEAIRLYDQALQIGQNSTQPDQATTQVKSHPSDPAKSGDFSDGIRQDPTVGTLALGMLKCHQNLARLYRKFGNMPEALEHAVHALTYQQQFSSDKENRSLEANELHNIGSIYLEMGSSEDALQFLTKSLNIYRSTYAPDHPSVQAVLTSIILAANQSRSNT